LCESNPVSASDPAIEDSGASAEAARARALLEVGRPRQAVPLLSAAVGRYPSHAELWCLLAWALIDSQEPTRALEAARQAVQLSPDQEWPHRLMSIALAETGDLPGAVTAARQAVRVEPHNWQAHNHLAGLLINRPGGRDDAFAAATEAVRLAPPDEPEPKLTLGELALLDMDLARAEQIYRRVLAEHPDHPIALHKLAIIQDKRGQTATSLQTLRSAIAAAPARQHSRRQMDVALSKQLLISAFVVLILLGLLLGLDAFLLGQWRWRGAVSLGAVLSIGAELVTAFRNDLAPIADYLSVRLRRGLMPVLTLLATGASLLTIGIGSFVVLLRPATDASYLTYALLLALLAYALGCFGLGRASAMASRAEATDAGQQEPGGDDDRVGTRGVLWIMAAYVNMTHLIALAVLAPLANHSRTGLYQMGVVLMFLIALLVDGYLAGYFIGWLGPYLRRFRRLPVPVTVTGFLSFLTGIGGLVWALRSLVAPISAGPLWGALALTAVLTAASGTPALVFLIRRQTQIRRAIQQDD